MTRNFDYEAQVTVDALREEGDSEQDIDELVAALVRNRMTPAPPTGHTAVERLWTSVTKSICDYFRALPEKEPPAAGSPPAPKVELIQVHSPSAEAS